MATIQELMLRAQLLREETAVDSISPERAGGIMYDTLAYINQMQLQDANPLLISKIYASVAAMEADSAPVSDLTGQPLRPGQVVCIVTDDDTDSDYGTIYRYDGTTGGTSSWTAVGKIGITGYQYMDVAHPGDTPTGYADLKCFWLASEPGTYENFGGLVVLENELAILKYSGSWSKDVFDDLTQFSALGIGKPLSFSLTKNLLIFRSTGKIVGVSGDNYVSSFIPVTPGKYAYRAKKPSNSFLAIAGYSSNNEDSYVSTFAVTRLTGVDKLEIVDIPDGVNYVRLAYQGGNPEIMGIWPLKTDGLLLYYYDKLDAMKAPRVISRNILDPDTLENNKYIGADGSIVSGDFPNFWVSGFISVEEGESITTGGIASGSSVILTIAAYNEVFGFVRGISGGENHYTQQGTEKYVRICLIAPRLEFPTPFACKGATLQEWDQYNTAESWYQGSKKPVISPSMPNYIYVICDNIQQYSLALYPDHLVDLRTVNLQGVSKKLLFKETNRDHLDLFAPIAADLSSYNGGEDKLEQAMSGTIIGDYKDAAISFTLRSILNSYTKNNPIRVLCIGDSVTAGTGSGYPGSLTGGSPKQYWHWMHRLCLDDQHNHNTSAYKYLSIGTRNKNEFEYLGNTYRDFAEGRGGWAVANYLFDASYLTMDNAFYDGSKVWTGDDADELNAANVKFSLSKYLARFKTLDDDGVTRLVVGSTAGTDVTDANAYDVCTPNVVLIQLSHNNTAADFATNMPLLIKAIRNEFPTMPIVISIADESGAYNTDLYPEFPKDALLYASLHSEVVKQIAVCKDIESQFSGLLFCPSNVIQPTAWSTAYKEMPKAASLAGKDFPFEMKIGAGANYHPSAIAHAAWAYQMLACIKWILS